jgi:hypothetical protein
MRILQRINKGHNDIDSGIFARQNHYLLLQRMLAKQWVSESDIKPYETFVI